MTSDTETSAYYIQQLAAMSKTPQHELIEEMLDYYNERGTIALSMEQIRAFYIQKLREEGHEHG